MAKKKINNGRLQYSPRIIERFNSRRADANILASSDSRGTAAQTIKQALLSSEDGTFKGFRDDIKKVFQQANRRIQNIEKAGLLSPALMDLNKGDIEGFSKFSISRCETWGELVSEYRKAMTFLASPTSSASGARVYNEYLRSKLDLSPALFDAVKSRISEIYEKDPDYEFYSYLNESFEKYVSSLADDVRADLASHIEGDAVDYGKDLDDIVDNWVNGIHDGYMNVDDIDKNSISDDDFRPF